ncbi:MAG TPA: NUDIX domain-containing protein [Geminicoccus sp.]|jgi:ADP-ribose pyrophosphatase YjhB (NUDIX family)|uniref:NUDIX domain-containing protein n=1 Tax=Geminicoccus sp. TaxID=2024832 RepID=UPI002E302FA2|nr:NUDIX domain-containing protein [Geminicoccus sp.]HEX2528044.1 NUDIX domain-containing protein [Geminicoccus sp.]
MPMSDYVRKLRTHLGHDLILLPSVAAVIRDDRDRMLLVRQIDSGIWSTPGGAIDPDENPSDAAVREAYEETGYHVELVRVLGVYGGPDYRVTYPNGDVTSYVSIGFEARIAGGTPRPDGEETSELRWFSEAELASAKLSIWARVMSADLFANRPATQFLPPSWGPAV